MFKMQVRYLTDSIFPLKIRINVKKKGVRLSKLQNYLILMIQNYLTSTAAAAESATI